MKKTRRTKKQPAVVYKATEKQTDTGTNKLLLFSVAFLVLIALLLLRNIFGKGKSESLKSKTIPDAIKKIVGDPKTVVTINNIKESSGVYEFELTLGQGSTARKYTSYITKDGKIIFTTGIKLSNLNQPTSQQSATQTKKLTCNDLTKSDSPKLTAFVVSNCPYGLQMQRLFKKTLSELPTLSTNLDIKYIGSINGDKTTSMHGDKEAEENLKQICLREEQQEKFWPYLSCYMQEGKSEDCSVTAGIDTVSLQTCATDKTRGLAYAKKDFDLATKYQIGSSPTLLLNNQQIVSEFDFGGRVANSIKDIVCCGSKTKGDYCQNKLSTDEVATAFSQTDSPRQGSSNNSANCGN